MTRFTIVSILPCLLAACDFGPTACTRELRYSVTPQSASIAVGQAFTASMQLSSCGGRERLSDTYRWRSDSPAVVTVDSVTGRVLGVGSGQAVVHVEAVHYGVEERIPVTVMSP